MAKDKGIDMSNPAWCGTQLLPTQGNKPCIPWQKEVRSVSQNFTNVNISGLFVLLI